jgi:uncharacterized membrane protein YsdA (DUF1294 family)
MVPFPVVVVYAVLSFVAFMLYSHDKRAARAGTRRTREVTLHAFDLLGGWPGGLLAQGWLRHKTRKLTFQLLFWVTVSLNCALLWWLFRAGYLV